jgi:hypothetical protein
MHTRLTLQPHQRGAKQLLARYGGLVKKCGNEAGIFIFGDMLIAYRR